MSLYLADGSSCMIPALGEPTVYARLARITGSDEPIIHRSFPFLHLPPEHLGVELDGPFGVIHADVEVYDSGQFISLLWIMVIEFTLATCTSWKIAVPICN